MTEIHLIVEEAPEGSCVARAMGADIFTEADDLQALRTLVKDAVNSHSDGGERPGLIHLHIAQ